MAKAEADWNSAYEWTTVTFTAVCHLEMYRTTEHQEVPFL